MKLLGVTTLIVTNASGGVNPSYKTGDVMIIKDHLSFPSYCGFCPLSGPNDERFGPRFPPMTRAYDKELRDLAKATAQELGFGAFIQEGVYSMEVGPVFETPTDTRFWRLCNIDTIGMSTVPEVETAVHCGLRVLGLSMISNMCTDEYDAEEATTHQDVLEAAQNRSGDIQILISAVVLKMNL